MTIIDGLGSDAIAALNVGHSLSINIEGFTITNGYYSIFVYHTSWVNVRDCIVKDSPIGVRASIGSGVRFYNTVFSNISHQAISSIWNGGPEFNNVTIDGVSTAIWLYQTSLRLNNTTITNVGTVFDFRRNPWLRRSHVNIWNYDTYFSSEYDQSRFLLTDIISVDPLFVDPLNDYRLQSGSPLIDAGTDIGLPFVGAAPDIGAYEFEELSLPEEVEELASSIAEAPAEIFRGPDEQRRDALYQKVEAVLNMVFSMDNGDSPEDRVRVLNGCLSKLQNDILARTDGNHGGNPANDWIIDSAEKTELYNNILNLIGTVQEEIDSINAL